MKCGLAAFVIAACRLANRLRATPGLVLVIVAGEETGCDGSRHLAAAGALGAAAGLGALLAMLVVGDELSVISIIGIVLLIGIVKKNGIILVDFALDVERTEGLSPKESIRKAIIMVDQQEIEAPFHCWSDDWSGISSRLASQELKLVDQHRFMAKEQAACQIA